jgi:hypothetical protein
VSEIREMNPALLNNIAPAGYELHVPKGSTPAIVAGLETVPEARRASWRVHRVGQGETLASIAKQYNTPVSSITSANTSTFTGVGDVLLIPAAIQPIKTRPVVATRRASARRSTTTARTTTAKTSVKPSAGHPRALCSVQACGDRIELKIEPNESTLSGAFRFSLLRYKQNELC